MATIKEILMETLTPSEFALLSQLTEGWTENPFSYDPERSEFEVIDQWLYHFDFESGPDQAAVDILLKASEILNSQIDRLGSDVLQYVIHQGGEFELSFTFNEDAVSPGEDDIQVGKKFIKSLEQYPLYRVSTNEGDGRLVVKVSFSYGSDPEFFSKKCEILWLLDAARQWRRGTPFKGKRL